MDRTLQSRLADGSQNEVASEAAATPHAGCAWKNYAGVWRNNPDFEAFLNQIEKIRREADEAEAEP